MFPDGTIQTTAANASGRNRSDSDNRKATGGSEKGAPSALNIRGAGTTNRVTKWLDGPAGVVGDSAITEVGAKVGIGTSSPTSRLHVFGAGNQGIALQNSEPGGRQWVLQSSVRAAGGQFDIIDMTGGMYGLSILSNGNVGIGAPSPTAKLTVTGMIETTSGGIKFPDGTVQTSRGLTSVSTACCTLNGNGTSGSPLSVSAPLTLESAALHSTFAGANTNANAASRGVYGQASGGIGVHGVHAATSGDAPGVKGETNSTSLNAVGVLGMSGRGSGVIGLSNAGIGISIPTTWAGVVGRNPVGIAVLGEGGTYGVYGRDSESGLEGAGVAGYSSSKVGVRGDSSSGNGVVAESYGQARHAAALRANNSNPNGGMAAYLTNNSNFATAHFANAGSGEVLYLQGNGNYFIKAVNNAANASPFAVTGDGTTITRVLQITGGSDLSERFEVKAAPGAGGDAAAVRPGLVVSIDPDDPGKLALSSRAYDRRVAGVISGAGGVKPGMMMGQAGSIADGHHPVALSGRVYCWADASNGPIEPGDMLTTSATPGHAMKATDHAKAQGAIIGKAMTSLKQGQGLVLVLVTLQ
jgi:hypothetical protein